MMLDTYPNSKIGIQIAYELFATCLSNSSMIYILD